ncbi:MAG: TIGR04283 family arsenosugar biosynthesis glycosyltransferase [Nitrospinae bacterium]|nr:TIGR04283 family arsenosugar biosynthesis glycosyltransferase [Nitrospinota bacterium]MBI3813598.1 TIGR04283 family arsenosugar biosynthesis glycosyltransferase [Nitrospinota bacterium]
MKLSIIIPTLNEESSIEKNLPLIKKELSAEIIVADGGSKDKTVEVAKRFTELVSISAAGRGIQMNSGASISTGDWLLFLHTDSIISELGIQRMIEVMRNENPPFFKGGQRGVIGGAFRLKIDSDRISLKIISSIANIRSRFFNIAYGDQGIFVKRDIFYKIGGYPHIPIMEDVEFVMKLKKRGKFVILPDYITVSSRRWDKEGVVYCTLRNWILILLYFMGISPHKLKGWYSPP